MWINSGKAIKSEALAIREQQLILSHLTLHSFRHASAQYAVYSTYTYRGPTYIYTCTYVCVGVHTKQIAIFCVKITNRLLHKAIVYIEKHKNLHTVESPFTCCGVRVWMCYVGGCYEVDFCYFSPLLVWVDDWKMHLTQKTGVQTQTDIEEADISKANANSKRIKTNEESAYLDQRNTKIFQWFMAKIPVWLIWCQDEVAKKTSLKLILAFWKLNKNLFRCFCTKSLQVFFFK